jgi:hypothetical protein
MLVKTPGAKEVEAPAGATGSEKSGDSSFVEFHTTLQGGGEPKLVLFRVLPGDHVLPRAREDQPEGGQLDPLVAG